MLFNNWILKILEKNGFREINIKENKSIATDGEIVVKQRLLFNILCFLNYNKTQTTKHLFVS